MKPTVFTMESADLAPELQTTEAILGEWMKHARVNREDHQLGVVDEIAAWEAATEDSNPQFLARCREAASVGLSLAKLHEQHTKVGFVPLPLGQYLEMLSRLAGVNIDSFLAAAGVTNLFAVTEKSADSVVALCRSLGFGVRETLLHIHLSLVADFAPLPNMVHSRLRASNVRADDSMSQYEAKLASLNTLLDDGTQQDIQRVLTSVQLAYANPAVGTK